MTDGKLEQRLRVQFREIDDAPLPSGLRARVSAIPSSVRPGPFVGSLSRAWVLVAAALLLMALVLGALGVGSAPLRLLTSFAERATFVDAVDPCALVPIEFMRDRFGQEMRVVYGHTYARDWSVPQRAENVLAPARTCLLTGMAWGGGSDYFEPPMSLIVHLEVFARTVPTDGLEAEALVESLFSGASNTRVVTVDGGSAWLTTSSADEDHHAVALASGAHLVVVSLAFDRYDGDRDQGLRDIANEIIRRVGRAVP